MRIQSILIENIKAIERLEFQPGTITMLHGSNGVGKSSVLDAISAVFASGHDPGLLRTGAKRGSVHLTLDDGTTLDLRVTEKTTVLEVKNAQGLIVPHPKTFVAEQLADILAVKPLDLLKYDATTAAGRKALAKALLEVMPIRFDPGDIQSACRSVAPKGGTGPVDAAGAIIDCWPERDVITLDAFTQLRKSVEETRRAVGVQRDEADKTAKTLAATVVDEAARVQAQLEAEQADRDIQRIASEAKQRRAELEQEYREAVREIDKWEADSQRSHHEKSELAKAKLNEYERAAGARDLKEQQAEKARLKTAEYDKLTTALSVMDRAREMKLSSLPVPGLVVTSDYVELDGIPWEHVNRAKLAKTVIELGALRGAKLPFFVLDDAEHLDGETWAAIEEAVREAGYQIAASFVPPPEHTPQALKLEIKE